MDTVMPEKKAKTNTKSAAFGTLRVKRSTRKRITEDLAKANRKDVGRRVKCDDYILLAISCITPDHIAALQDASMSRADRLERDYRDYLTKNGHISKDEYLGKRLDGEIPDPRKTAKDGVRDVENKPE